MRVKGRSRFSELENLICATSRESGAGRGQTPAHRDGKKYDKTKKLTVVLLDQDEEKEGQESCPRLHDDQVGRWRVRSRGTVMEETDRGTEERGRADGRREESGSRRALVPHSARCRRPSFVANTHRLHGVH